MLSFIRKIIFFFCTRPTEMYFGKIRGLVQKNYPQVFNSQILQLGFSRADCTNPSANGDKVSNILPKFSQEKYNFLVFDIRNLSVLGHAFTEGF